MNPVLDASAWVIPVVLAITLHEAAHGWMAERFGDDTARRLGRVTFNPIKHIDRFGTIVFPALLLLMHSPVMFGYAKPVPVDFRKLNPPRLGTFAVSVAGVCTNLLLALASGLLLHADAFTTPENSPWLFANLYRSVMINCVLIVFNLIPILPLDGGRAVGALMPQGMYRLFSRSERYGIILVLGLMVLDALLGLGWIGLIIGEPSYWLVGKVLFLTGNGG